MKLASWLDSKLLPEGVSTDLRDGLFAEFYPDGQLKHFGDYIDGSCGHAYALYLDHGVESGQAVLAEGSGGSADSNRYSDGTAEQFDAWSDNSPARPIEFRKWVTQWIASIEKSAHRKATEREGAEVTRAEIAAKGKRAVIKRVK